MTEDEVIEILLEYFESLFPKICPNCNRSFLSLREYRLTTTRIGLARISHQFRRCQVRSFCQ
jgi:hypothetical protein